MKIVSGGQTGVYRGALDAALSLGVPCGGNCPAGRTAPAKAAEQLRRFLSSRRVEVLNVAGPRASEWPEGYDFARQMLLIFLYSTRAPEAGMRFASRKC